MTRREYRKSDRKSNRKGKRRVHYSMLACICAVSLMTACGQSEGLDSTDSAVTAGQTTGTEAVATKTDSSSGTATVTFASVESLEAEEMFTNRDLKNGYDEEDAVAINLNGDSADCSDSSVEIDGTTITITKEGTYCLAGTLDDGIVIIDTDKSEKVQLVLDGVNISNSSGAAIYVRQADKVFITTAEGTVNTLSTTGEFEAIDENNIDAVIFSKEDLTLNGQGTLVVQTEYGHGIVSKDDLVIAGGTYEITAQKHGLNGKDSVRIADGDIRIVCGKDGIHSGNDDDDTVGFTYIEGGNITISADDDGIHSDTQLVIAGGIINIEKSSEGLEGKVIEIAGGDTTVVSSDDGLNATGGSSSQDSGRGGFGGMMDEAQEGVYILISGGVLNVNAGGDGIDSNGDLYITGGETYVSGPTYGGDGALDYAGDAQITGGILVAAGYSGMEQNMGSSSTQGSILLNTTALQEAGAVIELKDSEGNVLVGYAPEKTYNSVVVSCPEITVGETYTLHIGTESSEIAMTEIIYGTGSGFGMGGFGGGRGGFGGNEEFGGGRGDFGGNEEFGGGRGDFGGNEEFGGEGGDFGGKEEFGGGRREFGEGGDFGELPEFGQEEFGGRPGGRGGFGDNEAFGGFEGGPGEFDGERPEMPGQL